MALTLPFQHYSIQNPVEQEIDEIYSLLTYTLVYQDWQSASIPREKRRGYNIGALLVNPAKMPVYAGLNCINSTDNATQHGELRVMLAYLEQERCFNLKGFTIYTTLEPCIMCAGMMTMTNVARVVYGQKDLNFSNGLERLALDTSELGGYPPFQRTTWSDPSPSPFRARLDAAYHQYLQAGNEQVLAKFLTGEVAMEIFKEAHEAFLGFELKYEENRGILRNALSFLTNFLNNMI
ncbi:nucleoside deaminase [Haliscomenobacter sp.]|uniref:nucleoside deaminase n=1 Tax=Haliscomenobacter sp. TaxID=2717303 RepID=UPI003BAC58A0